MIGSIQELLSAVAWLTDNQIYMKVGEIFLINSIPIKFKKMLIKLAMYDTIFLFVQIKNLLFINSISDMVCHDKPVRAKGRLTSYRCSVLCTRLNQK